MVPNPGPHKDCRRGDGPSRQDHLSTRSKADRALLTTTFHGDSKDGLGAFIDENSANEAVGDNVDVARVVIAQVRAVGGYSLPFVEIDWKKRGEYEERKANKSSSAEENKLFFLRSQFPSRQIFSFSLKSEYFNRIDWLLIKKDG